MIVQVARKNRFEVYSLRNTLLRQYIGIEIIKINIAHSEKFQSLLFLAQRLIVPFIKRGYAVRKIRIIETLIAVGNEREKIYSRARLTIGSIKPIYRGNPQLLQKLLSFFLVSNISGILFLILGISGRKLSVKPSLRHSPMAFDGDFRHA